MAKDSETGHAINVAHLGLMNTAIGVMGLPYNPSNPLILATALVTKKADCDGVMQDVIDATVPWMNGTNARTEAYDIMSVLTTRAFGALESCGAKADIIKKAKGIKNKIEGKRTGKLPAVVIPAPVPPVVTVVNSVSQMSFDNRKANFTLFVAILAGEPLYAPNELDLTVKSLNKYISNLAPLNDTVNMTLKDLESARAARNIVLYDPNLGLFVLSKSVKKYVKSVTGTGDATYLKFTKIKFTNVRKKR